MGKPSIVVGSGVFGIAAVQAFLEAGRDVLWVSDERADAASSGECRIVRTAYFDQTYHDFAGDAMTAFMTEEPYRTYYKQKEWCIVKRGQEGQDQSISSDGDALPWADFATLFPSAQTDQSSKITRSGEVGLVEAGKLRQHMTDMIAKKDRVTKHTEKVTKVLFENGKCKGVELGSGSTLEGAEVVLATGWRTNVLLVDSDLEPVDYEIVGIPTMGIRPSAEQRHYLSKPIICVPGEGEIIPLKDDGIVIVNSHRSYLFPLDTARPADLASDHDCFNEPHALVSRYCPELRSCEVEFARMRYDGFTASQSPVFMEVNGADGLTVLGGGSFHHFKFLPVLHHAVADAVWPGKDRGIRWENLTNPGSFKHKNLAPKRQWPSQD